MKLQDLYSRKQAEFQWQCLPGQLDEIHHLLDDFEHELAVNEQTGILLIMGPEGLQIMLNPGDWMIVEHDPLGESDRIGVRRATEYSA